MELTIKIIFYIFLIICVESLCTTPKTWATIGPFPGGMREIAGMSLDAYTSIFTTSIDNSTYPSELGVNGRVGWQYFDTSDDGSVRIHYDDFEKSFLQPPYGWSILLWQGWAIGEFDVDAAGKYLVHCSNVIEYYVDSRVNHFHGDALVYDLLYSPIELTQGTHRLFVKAISSIRAYGNTANVTFTCQVQPWQSRVKIINTVASSVVNQQLVAPYATIYVLNNHRVARYKVTAPQGSSWTVLSDYSRIQNGQTKPVNFQLSTASPITSCPTIVPLCLVSDDNQCAPFNLTLNCAEFGSGYTFTFIDYDGSVQYAAAMPPASPCPSEGCAVIVALHGAGVDAGSPFWIGSFNVQKNKWILYPTGRRPWGYDWHGPSALNVFASLDVLERDLPGVQEKQRTLYTIDSTRLVYAGHSMGGAGTWMFASHFPDLAMASAPAAGFIAIEQYVPYYLRVGYAHIDKVLLGLLESAISEYDTNLYAANMVGMPLLVQYGSEDNNVPPWNSRRLARLVSELNHDPSSVTLVEVAGADHWWNSAMNGPIIQQLFDSAVSLPTFPKQFDAVTINPASSGSRGSVLILQSIVSHRMSRVSVTQQSGTHWTIKCQNVKRFGLTLDPRSVPLSGQITISTPDGKSLPFSAKYRLPEHHFCLHGGLWKVCATDDWINSGERTIEQYGPPARIFERPFAVVYGTKSENSAALLRLAVQIANDWFLYSGGNTTIYADEEMNINLIDELSLNLIVLGGPSENTWAEQIQSTLPVNRSVGAFSIGSHVISAPSAGAIYLAPSSVGQLMNLIIEGLDFEGLLLAARYLPYSTGVTVPDFCQIARWMSDGGVLAAGYWNSNWQVDVLASYFVN